jgi:hypothetical protein
MVSSIILAIASAILIGRIRINSVQGFALISYKDARLFFLTKAFPVSSITGDLTKDFQLIFLLVLQTIQSNSGILRFNLLQRREKGLGS